MTSWLAGGRLSSGRGRLGTDDRLGREPTGSGEPGQRAVRKPVSRIYVLPSLDIRTPRVALRTARRITRFVPTVCCEVLRVNNAPILIGTPSGEREKKRKENPVEEDERSAIDTEGERFADREKIGFDRYCLVSSIYSRFTDLSSISSLCRANDKSDRVDG